MAENKMVKLTFKWQGSTLEVEIPKDQQSPILVSTPLASTSGVQLIVEFAKTGSRGRRKVEATSVTRAELFHAC